ncbi:glycosyltransferase family 4 protein [Priestia megaterium]|uniref:glycosyltransferase family 4 protein n=1 Tax=Priestia megaterium TaxID=1404 RepID=UPI00203DD9C4|nr:glycosyltransferase family 4 protein [Priestia megaterium]MCM3306974.1 glycosyltransferase family 4 protein [Priestia megaterium]
MKDILIVAHFTQVPGEHGNGRFWYIINMLADKGHNVELVTTQFSHRTKKKRTLTDHQLNQLKYKLTMLNESGYKKNVSIKRFYSHYIFGRNLKRYLNNREKPDVIYCAVPSLDAAYVAAQFANDNNIKFVIDIQDLWPEAFKMVFNKPVISDLAFSPMNKKANYIYNSADNIIAVSETYVNRALSANQNMKKGLSVFLGTDLLYFDKFAKENKVNKPLEEIWLAYIGTLGNSYDLNTVIDALSILKDKGINNIKFIVMGDGPLKSKFQDYAKAKKVYAEFTGRLDYEEMVGILGSCDLAVNPIRSNSAGSIINKVGDYAAASLPVINTQESQEYQDLISSYDAGINCENGNPVDLAGSLLSLYSDSKLRKKMGENNRKLAEEKFDRNKTYLNLISEIMQE